MIARCARNYTLPTHTNTCSSRCNCVVDLAAHQAQALDAMDVSDPTGGHPSILPELVSPFPIFAANSASSRTHYTGSGTPTYTPGLTPQGSSRRSTLTLDVYFAGRSIKGLTPNLSAMYLHPFAVFALSSGTLSISSVPISSGGHRLSTTYSALHSLHHHIHPGSHLHLHERKPKSIQDPH